MEHPRQAALVGPIHLASLVYSADLAEGEYCGPLAQVSIVVFFFGFSFALHCCFSRQDGTLPCTETVRRWTVFIALILYVLTLWCHFLHSPLLSIFPCVSPGNSSLGGGPLYGLKAVASVDDQQGALHSGPGVVLGGPFGGGGPTLRNRMALYQEEV